MISVVIPCYNCGKTITRTLKSLEKQEYRNFETILINDGSVDNTLEIIEEYQKETSLRLLVFNKSNSGVSDARNLGLENCTGDYIAFLDADDLYSANFLAELEQALCMNNIDIAACRFSYVTIDETASVENSSCEWRRLNKYKLLETQKCKRRTKLNFYCCMYRKDIIDSHHIRFSSDLKYGEDTEFLCKYLYHCNRGGMLTKTALYGYTINADSAMHKVNYARVHNILAFERIMQYWQNDPKFNKNIGAYMIDRATWAVAKDFASGSRKCYRKFCKEYPLRNSMKRMVKECEELSVRITAVLFLISPYLFAEAIKLIKKC